MDIGEQALEKVRQDILKMTNIWLQKAESDYKSAEKEYHAMRTSLLALRRQTDLMVDKESLKKVMTKMIDILDVLMTISKDNELEKLKFDINAGISDFL